MSAFVSDKDEQVVEKIYGMYVFLVWKSMCGRSRYIRALWSV